MTFAELQAEFFASGFDYLNDNSTGTIRAKRWLNQAYLETCRMEQWPFLEATVSGVPPLAISDLDKVITVLDTTNDGPLSHSDYDSTVQDFPDPTQAPGPPMFWYLTAGTTISVAPPDATISLSVRYTRVPTELSAAGDTPLLPAAFHDVIVLGAWRRGLLDDSNTGDYRNVKQEWADRIGAMRYALLDNPDSQYLTFVAADW